MLGWQYFFEKLKSQDLKQSTSPYLYILDYMYIPNNELLLNTFSQDINNWSIIKVSLGTSC